MVVINKAAILQEICPNKNIFHLKKQKNMKSRKLQAIVMILGIIIIGFTQCTKKKGDSVSNVPVTITTPAITAVDTSWTLDQVHVGFVWKCLFMNLDNTYLTGKFNNFG